MDPGPTSCPDENLLLIFVDGQLARSAVASLEKHLAGCQECADLVARAVALDSRKARAGSQSKDRRDPRIPAEGPEFDLATLKRGDAIGRFVVLQPVGRGGMGEVYAAYDSELDRKVAVKLLKPRLSGSVDGRIRLLREAQTIAKLSHPNVVVVYEVGTSRDAVFIAMEFIRGNTVRAWLDQSPRSWRDVLPVFLAAGRGLVAAHDAGIVHRDFKPENVMITDDGQVRVMDFGLARQVASEEGQVPSRKEAMAAHSAVLSADIALGTTSQGDPSSESGARSGNYLRFKITQTGTQIGTPAYMAPEQFLAAGGVGAGTDQFSFCVSLYGALYGEGPFAGDTISELRANVLDGLLRPPPERRQVPSWIRRILMRGLATDPASRFPSMTALLRALGDDPGRRRRKLLMMTAGAMSTLLIAVAANRLGAGPRTMCVADSSRLAGVWDFGGVPSPRREAIRHAFAKTTAADSEQVFHSVARLLDDYVQRWMSMYTETCEATHVRGEQSTDVLDLRMACLRERLGNVRALTDILLNPDERVVLNAPSAAGALPNLERCADVPLLKAVVSPPEDRGTRRRVDEVRDQLAQLNALRDSGQCSRAELKATELIEAARAIGYRPLLADVLNASGLLVNNCGFPGPALHRLKEAYAVATAGHHDEAAANAAIILTGFAANHLAQDAMARDWLRIAQGALERLGHNPLLESWLLNDESTIYLMEHDNERALATIKQSLDIKRRVLRPDHPDVLIGEHNMAMVLAKGGHFHEALEMDRWVSSRVAALIGPGHTMRANLANNDGEVLNHLGRYAEAGVAFERALQSWRAAGSDPGFLSYGMTGLGLAMLGQGRDADAIAPLETAYAIRVERELSPTLISETQFALARALWSQQKGRSRAVQLAKQARANLGSDAETGTAAEIDAWLGQVERRRFRPKRVAQHTTPLSTQAS
jgi:serine/threonine protein kinase/tetratricopeptide (TPR) repeat protein